MSSNKSKVVRSIFSGLLLVSASSLISCSHDDVASRQGAITNVHQDMLDRRAARREARDKRFDASRDLLMNN